LPARRTDLESGAVVVSDAMTEAESVSLGLYFRTGSRDETPATNGISHFIEHLVFKGTPTRSAEEINREIDLLGGASNAFTTKETICLHTRVLHEHLPRVLTLFADLITGGLPPGIEAEVEREREVVLSEIRSADDTPEELVCNLVDAAYWGDHPLGYPIAGSAEVVASLPVSELRRQYRERLVGSRLVVAAAGRVRHEELVARVRDQLEGARAQPAALPAPAGSRSAPARRVVERDLEQVHVGLCSPGVAAGDARWAAGELLSIAVGEGYSSRLFREVRERRGLAYAVGSSLVTYTDTGTFNIDFNVPPQRLCEALEVVSNVLADVRDRGLDEAELAVAKELLRGRLVLAHESNAARMTYLGEQVVAGEAHLDLQVDLAALQRVEPAEVSALARELFGAPLALAVVGPVDASALPERAWSLPA
jgi:predicted Zn-dependent peptidase